MNTEITIHPKLNHYGLTTANLKAMVEWYHTVLGMTVNHWSEAPAGAGNRVPFSAAAFLSNDEVNHRLVFFEVPGVVLDSEKSRHTRLQHVAFEYEKLDELLGSYARLKDLGIVPVWAADHSVGTAFYYTDPDQNIVELNVNNYGNEWTATEHIKSLPPKIAFVDPDKMIAARKAGASAWEVHERALAGELAPTKPYDGRAGF